MAEDQRAGPSCLCGVQDSSHAGTGSRFGPGPAVCPVHGSRAAAWLQGPPEQPPAPKARRTRADAMAEKAESRKLADEGKLKPGSCSRCGLTVMFTRMQGLLYVVEAIPVHISTTWQAVLDGAGVYLIVDNKLKPATKTAQTYYKSEYVFLEHIKCGRVVPRLIELPKVETKSKDDGDVPPFELKPWRCWDCRELIQPEQQGISLSYDGPDMSYYMCHCDRDCKPVGQGAKLKQRQPRYPKLNPRTMKYEAPKKGEVLPDE